MQRRCLSIYGTCVGVHLEIILGYKKEGAFNKGKKEKKKSFRNKILLAMVKTDSNWLDDHYLQNEVKFVGDLHFK